MRRQISAYLRYVLPYWESSCFSSASLGPRKPTTSETTSHGTHQLCHP
jgi:hypothetical protein